MRLRETAIVGTILLVACLTGCATPTAGGAIATPESNATPESARTPESTPTAVGEVAAARAQAQAWLDAANLPPGAVRTETMTASVNSYTGWPCGPVEKLEAYWAIPGATVRDTFNWLRENPTANLLSTSVGPLPDNPAIDAASIGYIPERGAQEGIVYTVGRSEDGVGVRAEIAALTASATCPPLPDGGQYGPPGQG
jgi:hypothetical protein